jgi:hypothetical protein
MKLGSLFQLQQRGNWQNEVQNAGGTIISEAEEFG